MWTVRPMQELQTLSKVLSTEHLSFKIKMDAPLNDSCFVHRHERNEMNGYSLSNTFRTLAIPLAQTVTSVSATVTTKRRRRSFPPTIAVLFLSHPMAPLLVMLFRVVINSWKESLDTLPKDPKQSVMPIQPRILPMDPMGRYHHLRIYHPSAREHLVFTFIPIFP